MQKIAGRINFMGEAAALALALFDKRTRWAARLVAAATLLYLIDPFDLVTDLIPLLGWLDDAIVIPLGLWLAGRMIPREVMADARARFAKKPI